LFESSSLFKPALESHGPTKSPDGHRQYVLDINGLIVNGRIRIDWMYSENIHNKATIEKLSGYFAEALRRLISHCQSLKTGSYTPSDFPDANLTQEKLDKILSRVSKPTTKDAANEQP